MKQAITNLIEIKFKTINDRVRVTFSKKEPGAKKEKPLGQVFVFGGFVLLLSLRSDALVELGLASLQTPHVLGQTSNIRFLNCACLQCGANCAHVAGLPSIDMSVFPCVSLHGFAVDVGAGSVVAVVLEVFAATILVVCKEAAKMSNKMN